MTRSINNRGRDMKFLCWLVLGAALISAAVSGQTPSPTQTAATAAASIDELVGLWRARRYLGPEIRGRLLLLARDGQWVADIAGYSVPATLAGDRISFKLPDGKGEFRGQLTQKPRQVIGFWFQPP